MHPGNMLARVTDLALMAPAVRTASANGPGVDVTDYEGVGLILVASSAEASTGTCDVTIQDSPDNSTWSNVTLLDGAFGQITNAGTFEQVRRIDVQGGNKFIRAVQTVGGGSPSAMTSVSFLGIKKVASA